jgi:hypothetical protein
MAESVAENQPGAPRMKSRRTLHLVAGTGRVGRWLVCSVLLAAAPISISFFFSPESTTMTSFLARGDFAVLALALVTASLGELLGPDEPPKFIRNILLLACLSIGTAAGYLLSFIAGHAPRMSSQSDARDSLILFITAVILGAASWASTSHLCRARSQDPVSAETEEARGEQEA